MGVESEYLEQYTVGKNKEGQKPKFLKGRIAEKA